jgi:hypothetical protein
MVERFDLLHLCHIGFAGSRSNTMLTPHVARAEEIDRSPHAVI